MRIGTIAAAAALVLLIGSAAAAEVKTKDVAYKQGDTVLQGFLAWDDAIPGKRPGILVVHEWWGHNAHARNQARRFAEAGYVAFALDMYGKGKSTTHPKEAEAFMNEALKDLAVLPARFNAALDQLKQDPHVDPARIGAAGYCFGGAVSLAMARAGEDLKGVVAFHGALPPPAEVKPGQVKARLLLLEGGADPMVPAAQVETFEKAMKAAGANIRVVTYPGVKHGYTNPDAAKFGMDGLAYDAKADKASWAEATAFFKDAFAQKQASHDTGRTVLDARR